jgi:hypothetical protein
VIRYSGEVFCVVRYSGEVFCVVRYSGKGFCWKCELNYFSTSSSHKLNYY